MAEDRESHSDVQRIPIEVAPADTTPDMSDKQAHRLSRAGLLKAAAGTVGALLLGRKAAGPAFAAESTDVSTLNSVHDTTIVRCAIHPGIGIARVGNSTSDYFMGPEVPGVTPNLDGSYKDEQGRIKRQAARFRIFGLNASGQVVKELGADDAAITWTVHLANKKAAWYQFRLALDIPEATSPTLPPEMRSMRRNATIRGRDRRRLAIDPGLRSIRGKKTQGRIYHFDSGSFLGRRVPLGELRTDAAGRLLVFGGLGTSGTTVPNNPPTHIANNDGWYDDTSDGPVTAKVVLHGKALPVQPAWVIVALPNYAPGVVPIVTLYDIVYQAYLDDHPPVPAAVSFTQDIYPILQRFDRLQWVNEGFFRGYGWQGEVALLDPSLLTQLASNEASTAKARQAVFNRFRDPSYGAMQEDAWPRMYGDNFAQPPASARQYLAVTREQYRRLGQWAVGNFSADRNPDSPLPQTLTDLPLQDRPGALDRAALEACSGGAFHPGEEAPWTMRHSSLYSGLGRLRPRHPTDSPEPDFGGVLTPKRALGSDGPLHRSGPGDITRWMAVPWQTDAANCGSAYPNSTVQPPRLPDLPTFWPAMVPNKILTEQAYQRVLDAALALSERQSAFVQRLPWGRHLSTEYQTRNDQFIADWYRLGFITQQLGSADSAFPEEFHVETESSFPEGPLEAAAVPSDRGSQTTEQQPTSPPLLDRRAHL